jgi:H+/Cl- antiporter ClcA
MRAAPPRARGDARAAQPPALRRPPRRPLRTPRHRSTPPPGAAAPDGVAATAPPVDPPTPPHEEVSEAAILAAACGVGVATGVAVVLLNDAVEVVRAVAWAGAPLEATHWGRWARSLPWTEALPILVLPPAAAGAAVGALRAAAGGSLDDPPLGAPRSAAVRAPLLRALAAALTLGGGASLGPEGPAVDIGRSVARGAAALLRSRGALPLLAAGAGAGVAAGFGAPISGVFFAIETVLTPGVGRPPSGDDPGSGRAPSPGLSVAAILLASVLAAVVSTAGLGGSPAVRVPAYAPFTTAELPLTLALGALAGAVALAWRAAEAGAAAAAGAAERAGAPAPALPLAAGAATGALALLYPEILYQGFGNVNALLAADAGEYGPGLLAQLAVAKVAATALCRGGRLVGGLYAPSILVGAALGGAFGSAVGGAGVADPPAYALVGAAAVLAAACGVPLTASLLVFELTRDYVVIVPTLGAAGVAAWVAGGGLARSAAPAAVATALAGRSATASAVADGRAATSAGAAEGAASAPAADDSALCAADAACVVLPADTPLAAARALLEGAAAADPGGAPPVAVLLAADGGVAGVLTLAGARAATDGGGATAGDAAEGGEG